MDFANIPGGLSGCLSLADLIFYKELTQILWARNRKDWQMVEVSGLMSKQPLVSRVGN